MSQDRLVACFVKALGVSAAEVGDDLAYGRHRKWTSVAHMVLVAEIETEFGVMLDTDDIVDMSSPAKAREILAKLGAAS